MHRMPTAVVARSTTVRPVSNRDRSHASFRMSRPARSSFFRTLELAVSDVRNTGDGGALSAAEVAELVELHDAMLRRKEAECETQVSRIQGR